MTQILATPRGAWGALQSISLPGQPWCFAWQQ